MANEFVDRMFPEVAPDDLDLYFPFYPLDAPGMPSPGPNFLAHATALAGNDPEETRMRLDALYRAALYRRDFFMPVLGTDRATQYSVQFLPGGPWGQLVDGPRQARVMVVGKHPGFEEIREGRNLVGKTSQTLLNALAEIGVPPEEYNAWHVCNIVRFVPPGRQGGGNMPVVYTKDCLPLLHQELRLLRPDYLLCLGDDAVKALLGPSYNAAKLIGIVTTLEVPLHTSENDKPVIHRVKMVASMHPARVFHQTDMYPGFRGGISYFVNTMKGTSVTGGYDGLQLYEIRNPDQLAAWESYIDALGVKDFAVDCEWVGEYPEAPGSYLRTVQIAWSDNEACCVVLEDQNRTPFPGDPWAALHRVLKHSARRRVRIIGHNFRADLPWLARYGLDLTEEFAVAATPDRTATEGGFDTMIGVYSWQETHPLGLEVCTVQLLGLPRYDQPFSDWIDARRAVLGLKKKQFPTIAGMPDSILHRYGMLDAIVTYRLFRRLNDAGGSLDKDRNNNPCRKVFHRIMRADPVFLEMEREGMPISMVEAESLMLKFKAAKDKLLHDLREQLNWPDFNPNSQRHKVSLLFGDSYLPPRRASAAKSSKTAKDRPPDAITYGFRPLKTTGKRAKLWCDLEATGETEGYAPSTDKGTIMTLFSTPGVLERHPSLALLMDLNYAKHVIQNTLKPPTSVKTLAAPKPLNLPSLFEEEDTPAGDEPTADEPEEEEGESDVYEGGLLSYLREDGRVHSHIFATCETGRLRSSKPALQNLSAKREEDYQRILGDQWQPLRGIFAAPPGYVFVSADYVSAEADFAGVMSNCKALKEHVRRSTLDPSDPDYYELHCNTAVRAFKLQCAPTKKALKAAGKLYLRTAAKATIYGWFYGQGATSAALKAREEGAVSTTDHDAQVLIDWLGNQYWEMHTYFTACEDRVNYGFIRNCFGRDRRCVMSDDRKVQGDLRRQFRNFCVQSGVADTINEAMPNLAEWRARTGVQFHINLQVHDALELLVPYANVERVVEEGLPWAMCQSVDIWPSYPDGSRRPEAVEPHHLSIDVEVGERWSVKLTKDRAKELGIPSKYAAG